MQAVFIYSILGSSMLVFLSVRVIRKRRQLQIAIGDQGNPAMLRAMRVQSNCAEYLPLGLLMLYFVREAGSPIWLIHVLGIMLIGGRISHAYGVGHEHEHYVFRVAGMALTFSELLMAAVYLTWSIARTPALLS
jgi:uncharacterized membrane protein YecN with MAPEG domain